MLESWWMPRKSFVKKNCIAKLSTQHSDMEWFYDWFGTLIDLLAISQWMSYIDCDHFEINSSRFCIEHILKMSHPLIKHILMPNLANHVTICFDYLVCKNLSKIFLKLFETNQKQIIWFVRFVAKIQKVCAYVL